jgi:lipoprotein signal peptidase
VLCFGRMRRRSTLWFLIATVWFVLFVIALAEHRSRKTAAVGAGVLLFLAIGMAFRLHENRQVRRRGRQVESKPE